MRALRADRREGCSGEGARRLSRQAPHAKEHPLPGGDWIDGVASHDEKGHASSVDVLVAKLRSEAAGSPNEKQELIVEILTRRVRRNRASKRAPVCH